MEQPAFEYIELVDGCHVDRTFSFGNGEFHHHNDDTPMKYAFSVYKDIALGKLDVTIWSVFLRHALALTDPYIINLPAIIQQYPFLKNALFRLDEPNSLCASHENAKELRLLTEGLLLDRKVFNGFNLEHLYNQGIISRTHWQDIQHWSTMNDLRVIDEAFQKLCHAQAEEANEDDEDLPSGDVLGLPSQNHGVCSAALDWRQENCIPSPSTTRSADYQILRSIQTLWEQLSETDSNPQELIDFEDTWIWELHKSCNISRAEQDWLDRVIGDCEVSREIKLLLCSSGLKDASRLRNDIIFCNAVDDPRGAIHHSYDSTFCSIRPLSVDEKRRFLERRLHAVFKEEDQRFRDKVRKINWDRQPAGYKRAASIDMGSCGFIFQWYNKAWNKGVATIRRFLQGRRPGTLEQICRLLQVAYAMGSQDPTNPNFRASFANDLDRWRTIVPEHSLLYFDAIVEAVWKKTFDKVQSNGAMGCGADENLLHLQQLLSGLISRNPVAEISKDDEQQADPVRTDEQMFNAGLSAGFYEAQYVLDGFEDPRAYSHVRKLPFCWEPAEPVIVLMMAGAIFGFIFSFLLIFHALTSPGISYEVFSRRGLCFANFEERNVHTLLLYLGLSTSSLWQDKGEQCNGITASQIFSQTAPEETLHLADSISLVMTPQQSAPVHTAGPPSVSLEAASQSSKVDRLRCRRCGKRFSNVGNRNRHMRSDCEHRAQFPCRNPGCMMVSTRKAYRDKHEVLNCPQRWLLG